MWADKAKRSKKPKNLWPLLRLYFHQPAKQFRMRCNVYGIADSDCAAIGGVHRQGVTVMKYVISYLRAIKAHRFKFGLVAKDGFEGHVLTTMKAQRAKSL
jgi:hypothetical protein